jgi:hypothetical protein
MEGLENAGDKETSRGRGMRDGGIGEHRGKETSKDGGGGVRDGEIGEHRGQRNKQGWGG